MKKLSLLILAMSACFAGSALAQAVPYTGGATTSASGVVNSQSAASAISNANGTAFSATQSGSFSTYGQAGNYVNAPVGAVGGTASVTGFAATSQYATSTSSSTGTGNAASNSWNSAVANVSSYQNAVGNGLTGYTGGASGAANSATSATVGTASAGGVNTGAIQGSQASNNGGYSASDSGIMTTSTVTPFTGGTPVSVTNYETQTSASAFNNSAQVNTTVFGTTAQPNVGVGDNTVVNGGGATATAN